MSCISEGNSKIPVRMFRYNMTESDKYWRELTPTEKTIANDIDVFLKKLKECSEDEKDFYQDVVDRLETELNDKMERGV